VAKPSGVNAVNGATMAPPIIAANDIKGPTMGINANMFFFTSFFLVCEHF